jgi:hypothetical protein
MQKREMSIVIGNNNHEENCIIISKYRTWREAANAIWQQGFSFSGVLGRCVEDAPIYLENALEDMLQKCSDVLIVEYIFGVLKACEVLGIVDQQVMWIESSSSTKEFMNRLYNFYLEYEKMVRKYVIQ